MLIDYINKHNDFILTQEYCDEDLSGAGTYRPEFERLIQDCENKKLDIVLCKSQSRFSRDMEIVEKYINNKFKEWNIRFIGISDNADTEIIGNKKSRQINGLVNEWYLEDVSNNIKSAFNSKMKQGEFISPFAPFGYKIDKNNNNKLIIDPYAKEIVVNIYNLYLKGLGYTSIANSLNNNNIPSPSLYKYQQGIKLNIVSNKPRKEIKWSPNAIKTILTNEIYLGHLIQGKRTTISYKNHKIKNKNKEEWIKVENTHEKIIDKETFDQVQKNIKERTKTIKSKEIHPFSGKVYCLECNSYMRKKNTSKHQYLVCTNKNNNCTNTKSIRYDTLEKLIIKEINKNIKKYHNIDLLKKELLNNNKLNNKINLLQEQKKELEKELSKTNNYLKNLYEDKVNNIITTNEFKELITIYNTNQKELTNKLNIVNNNINNNQNINIDKIIPKYLYINKLTRTITQEFINKIYIDKINNNTRIIKIIWN